MAPASSLSEIGDGLVDLHGQHVHQSLLHQAAQRDALDSFAGSDLEEVSQARRELAVIDARLAELGGDPRVLVRTVGLLRFQLDEIAAAAITALDEEEQLGAEESLLTQIGPSGPQFQRLATPSRDRTPPRPIRAWGPPTCSE